MKLRTPKWSHDGTEPRELTREANRYNPALMVRVKIPNHPMMRLVIEAGFNDDVDVMYAHKSSLVFVLCRNTRHGYVGITAYDFSLPGRGDCRIREDLIPKDILEGADLGANFWQGDAVETVLGEGWEDKSVPWTIRVLSEYLPW